LPAWFCVLISKQLDPKGVSIAINPKNTKQQVAGAGMANAYYSEDGGISWKKSKAICDAFRLYGTPRVFWDTLRKAWFTDVAFPNPEVVTDGSWVDRIILNRSDSAGKSYANCEDVGKNGKKVQMRHFASVNEKNNEMHLTWTQFDRFESKAPEDTSHIRYSRSSNGGKTWSEPKTISSYYGNCSNGDSTVMGAVSCTGPGGEIYVCWAGPKGLLFQRYRNSWAKEEKVLAPLRGGWDFKVNGTYKANGLPSIVCDNSKGAHNGRIYVCWCDERNGENNEDIFYMYSDDGGETWIDPVILTYYSNHKAQFMPVMCLDNSTGHLYILYYDKKNYLE
jgi:Neuraminidase (sialidase)